MHEKTDLFNKLLSVFHRKGVLQHLILIGSWCKIIYRQYFSNAPEIPALRTTDIDFLIPSRKISTDVDLALILSDLGFEKDFALMGGSFKFVHPDLELEFLTPETGPPKEKPVVFENLHVSAQALRFLSILQDHTITLRYHTIPVTVPQPAAFVLHKLLILKRRKNPKKAQKDLSDAVQIGEFLLSMDSQKQSLADIFSSLPSKWKNTLLRTCESASVELATYLKTTL